MDKKVAESAKRKGKWLRPGCMTFTVIYGLCLIAIYIAGTPPKQTKDFTGRTAWEFTVAAFTTDNSIDGVTYRVLNLEYLNSRELDLTDLTFLLPEREVFINVGDLHNAEILEDHGEWQLVAFYYSNTRTSTSIYRAYQDRIEPVSYKITSHVGQVIGAFYLFIPALLLSIIVTAIINWRARRAIKTEDD